MQKIKKALFAAFPLTLPILAGFVFLGLSYGIFMSCLGFSFWYPMLMSLLIFAGSMEFAAASFLLGGFHPFQAFLLTLLINFRHLFYGISMLEKFKGCGRLKPYLIFGMCDESFAINYNADIPPDVDPAWFMFFVTLLNHLYWFLSATAGGILGNVINLKIEGVGFVLTTLFTVIFLEQLLKEKRVFSAIVGIASPILCLMIFGKDKFIIPSMLLILALISCCRTRLERVEEVEK
jgi:4-azaleucine resistance transporter AzlC